MSTAGGLVNAHARGIEIGANAIQVFNQSPRMWRPTRWKDHDVAAFLDLMASGKLVLPRVVGDTIPLFDVLSGLSRVQSGDTGGSRIVVDVTTGWRA